MLLSPKMKTFGQIKCVSSLILNLPSLVYWKGVLSSSPSQNHNILEPTPPPPRPRGQQSVQKGMHRLCMQNTQSYSTLQLLWLPLPSLNSPLFLVDGLCMLNRDEIHKQNTFMWERSSLKSLLLKAYIWFYHPFLSPFYSQY